MATLAKQPQYKGVKRKMKILLINKFLFPKGGDAISTLKTGELLRAKGHQVIFWGMKHPSNPPFPYQDDFMDFTDYYTRANMFAKIKMPVNILYSTEAQKRLDSLLAKERPDIAHLNNFAHQISPSILIILKKYNIPMVMTMRDYKLVCPTYNLFSKDKPCEKCRQGRFYMCFVNRCSHNSYLKSLVNVVEMYLHHHILHLYDLIDIFISPSEFLKNKVKEMGFKREVTYLPNFLDFNHYQPRYSHRENTIVYLGRISREKGLLTLIHSVSAINNIQLKIIGEGPLKSELENLVNVKGINNVSFLGFKSGDELKNTVADSLFVVVPSEWYENNPRTVLEAFALGKPVIGADIGGIPELVKNWETGLTFKPGDPDDLKEKIVSLLKEPDKIVALGKNARVILERDFNPDRHYRELMNIYSIAMEKH